MPQRSLKSDLLTIPNLVTFGRLLCIPFVVYFICIAHFQKALCFFTIAAISDALDGFLARYMKAQSALGSFLDPLADKLLFLFTFLSLGYLNIIPLWFVLLSIGRDLFIVLGYFIIVRMYNIDIELRPLLISKVNTLTQSILVIAYLVFLSFNLYQVEILFLLKILLLLNVLTIFTSSFGYIISHIKYWKRSPPIGFLSIAFLGYLFIHSQHINIYFMNFWKSHILVKTPQEISV
jgi:cardiolipin synthase (CMP-forming)